MLWYTEWFRESLCQHRAGLHMQAQDAPHIRLSTSNQSLSPLNPGICTLQALDPLRIAGVSMNTPGGAAPMLFPAMVRLPACWTRLQMQKIRALLSIGCYSMSGIEWTRIPDDHFFKAATNVI